MAFKKNQPPPPSPTAPPPDPHANIFGDPESTGAHIPLSWDQIGSTPGVSKSQPATKSAASKSPVAFPAAHEDMPMIAEEKKSDPLDDIFSDSERSGAMLPPKFETTTSDRKKKEKPKPAPAPGLDVSQAIVFDEPEGRDSAPPASRSQRPAHYSTDDHAIDFGLGHATPESPFRYENEAEKLFGKADASSAGMPPDWSNAAGTASVAGTPVVPQTPTPPTKPSKSNLPTPSKKPEMKGLDFPTPPPFKPTTEDRFVTPPPLSPFENLKESLATPPPPQSAPASKESSKPDDPWGAFFEAQKTGREEEKARRTDQQKHESAQPQPILKPLQPSPRPVIEDRIADDSAATVRRDSELREPEPPAAPAASAYHTLASPPPPKSSGEELFVGSNREQTMVWSRHYAQDRGLSLNPKNVYGVILAPASPVLAPAIIEIMRERLGMNDTGILYALKHRHGILADDLPLQEAVDLADKLNQKRQAVCVVERDERLAFNEPQDVMRVKFEGKSARFFTAEGIENRKYKDLVGIGCGSVATQSGSVERDVIDLFFAQPGLHLRLWRNTLMAAPPVFSGKIENRDEFHALGRHLIELAPDAIQTNAFIQWTKGNTPTITSTFSGLIEYENYTRWYLMAHYGRSKAYDPTRPPG